MFKVEFIADKGPLRRNERIEARREYREIHALDERFPLLAPDTAAWNSIRIEHHRQPAAECELRSADYIFCILLNACRTEKRVNDGHIQTCHTEPGDVIIYPASSHHWIRWQGEIEFLLLFLDAALVAQMGEDIVGKNTIEIMEREQEIRDPLLQQIALALKSELDEDMVPASALYAESLATAMSAHLLRHYAVQGSSMQENITRPSNAVVRRVIEYIHDNLEHQLTLAELSFIANMSSYHFSRIFKQATGMAPHQYVLQVRIERAKSLLLQGKLSIAEIAKRVGFYDQSHFTRYFKREVGVTPQTLLLQNSKNIPDLF